MPQEYEIILRDLESILKKQLGDDLILKNFENDNLVKVGENYGSTILKVHAVVAKNNVDGIEDLQLVAKMMPPTDHQRKLFESNYSFKKEIFLYEDLIPIYKKIYRDFDLTAKFYGSRLSMNSDADEADQDAVLLLENLKIKGYSMEDRFKGLDLEHLKITITALARFHAIGLSLKYKEPLFLSKLKNYAKPLSMDPKGSRSYVETMLNTIENDHEMGPNFYRIKALDKMEHLSDERLQIILEPEDPWACVVHRDFWNNNMMFHCNDNGKVDDIKMVDFQTYCISSPMTDLVFLLCTSSQLPLSKHFDEMTEFYRRIVYDVIEELECDPSLFVKESFEEKLKIDAISELYHSIIMSRVVELREGEELEKTLPNEFCVRRLRHIVELYVNKGWI